MISKSGKNFIFLISQPRAGSTMLQRILAQHSKISTVAEPWVALPALHTRTVRAYHPKYRFKTAQNAFGDFLSTFPNPEQTFLNSAAAMIASLYKDALQSQNAERFLDKTPTYYLIIPELVTMFPDAKFIFLFRNPLAVLHSILETWVHNEWFRLARHKSNLLLAPRLLLDGSRLVNDNALTVHYENFVAKPDEQLRLICDFLEIEFFVEMLQYEQSPADYARMGDPTGINQFSQPSAENPDKWQNLGKTPQTKYLANHYIKCLGRDTLAEMGYDIGQLASGLETYKIPRKGLVIPWEYFFPEKQSFFKILRLIFIGFIVTPNPSLLFRQIRQLFSETFIQHTAWYG